MSQEPASPQTPAGPITEALGLWLASSQAASQGEGKREAGIACCSAHVYLWASLLLPRPRLRGGKRVGRAVPAEIKPAPRLLAPACPTEGPRLVPLARLSQSQLLTGEIIAAP